MSGWIWMNVAIVADTATILSNWLAVELIQRNLLNLFFVELAASLSKSLSEYALIAVRRIQTTTHLTKALQSLTALLPHQRGSFIF